MKKTRSDEAPLPPACHSTNKPFENGKQPRAHSQLLSLLGRRFCLGLLTLLALSAVVFASTQILPGDVASAVLGRDATEEALRAFRQTLGLDQPALLRYFSWLSNALHGDFGLSLANGAPIIDQIRFRLENTLLLAAVAAIISIPLAVVLGIVSAIKSQGRVGSFLNIGALAAISIPEFLFGYLLILVFSTQLGWFSAISMVLPDMDLTQRLSVVILPAFTLAPMVWAYTMRMTRTAVLSVMSQPYIEMAILKGEPRSSIVLRQALPNAMAPLISVVALNLAYLIVGVIVVETIFVYPGIGQYMVDAVGKRDIPTVQACGLIFGATYVLINLLADLLVIITNPRLRGALK
ncbi:ABC transporter permease [Pseudomonas grandcourensis]|uniref:ABC transporter permease n=1 Tax=Pseudomonas grandcourensis TaxID=3136736 RepID=UPI003264948E